MANTRSFGLRVVGDEDAVGHARRPHVLVLGGDKQCRDAYKLELRPGQRQIQADRSAAGLGVSRVTSAFEFGKRAGNSPTTSTNEISLHKRACQERLGDRVVMSVGKLTRRCRLVHVEI